LLMNTIPTGFVVNFKHCLYENRKRNEAGLRSLVIAELVSRGLFTCESGTWRMHVNRTLALTARILWVVRSFLSPEIQSMYARYDRSLSPFTFRYVFMCSF
jgi:hypothetical protein